MILVVCVAGGDEPLGSDCTRDLELDAIALVDTELVTAQGRLRRSRHIDRRPVLPNAIGRNGCVERTVMPRTFQSHFDIRAMRGTRSAVAGSAHVVFLDRHFRITRVSRPTLAQFVHQRRIWSGDRPEPLRKGPRTSKRCFRAAQAPRTSDDRPGVAEIDLQRGKHTDVLPSAAGMRWEQQDLRLRIEIRIEVSDIRDRASWQIGIGRPGVRVETLMDIVPANHELLASPPQIQIAGQREQKRVEALLELALPEDLRSAVQPARRGIDRSTGEERRLVAPGVASRALCVQLPAAVEPLPILHVSFARVCLVPRPRSRQREVARQMRIASVRKARQSLQHHDRVVCLVAAPCRQRCGWREIDLQHAKDLVTSQMSRVVEVTSIDIRTDEPSTQCAIQHERPGGIELHAIVIPRTD